MLLGVDQIRSRLPLRRQQEYGQPRASCPPSLSPELVDVNGKVMAEVSTRTPCCLYRFTFLFGVTSVPS